MLLGKLICLFDIDMECFAACFFAELARAQFF